MKLAKIHDKLNDLVDIINQCFSIPISFSVGTSFVFMVFCTFQLFHLTKDPSQASTVAIVMMWGIYYSAFSVAVFATASNLTVEVRITTILFLSSHFWLSWGDSDGLAFDSVENY